MFSVILGLTLFELITHMHESSYLIRVHPFVVVFSVVVVNSLSV